MEFLKEKKLDILIPALRQPVLGICLGMQLMCGYSEENDTACLGIFPELRVRKFAPDHGLKIPQTGWNTVHHDGRGIFSGINQDCYGYFVHGYYVEISPATTATTRYGITYSASIQKENFYGVQFHPEKSAETGEKILQNFITL